MSNGNRFVELIRGMAIAIAVTLLANQVSAQEFPSGQYGYNQNRAVYSPPVVDSNYGASWIGGSACNSDPLPTGRLIRPVNMRTGYQYGASSTTLPTGRRYIYGNRYFGTINNRYYGPQYGNF